MTTTQKFAIECAEECAYYRGKAAMLPLGSPVRATYLRLAWNNRVNSRKWASKN